MAHYADKLRTIEWRQRRTEVIERAGGKCSDCGRRMFFLEVHHCAYIPGALPWEHGDDLLMAVCRECHEARQRVEDSARVMLGKMFRQMTVEEIEKQLWEFGEIVARRQTEKDKHDS